MSSTFLFIRTLLLLCTQAFRRISVSLFRFEILVANIFRVWTLDVETSSLMCAAAATQSPIKSPRTYARGFTSKLHYTNWSSNSRPWRPTGATTPLLILLCNWPSCLLLVGYFKGPMEMLERDHDFQCSGFCVCFRVFFQVNGVAGFGSLNYYFNYLVWTNNQCVMTIYNQSSSTLLVHFFLMKKPNF